MGSILTNSPSFFVWQTLDAFCCSIVSLRVDVKLQDLAYTIEPFIFPS